MRTFEENKRIYAELILKFWLNLQQWQNLIIKAPMESCDFVKLLSEIAYKNWTPHIFYDWANDELDCIKYKNAPEESFDYYPQWEADGYTDELKKWAAKLTLYMSDSRLFEDINPEYLRRKAKAFAKANKEYRSLISKNGTNWVIAAVPIKWWANMIYWNNNTEENVEKLWNQIFSLVRIDKEDPIKAREEHVNDLKKHAEYMNAMNFKKLHYKSLKTNLEIELPEWHIWMCAWEKTPSWIVFHPNLPTEEIFSMPHKYWVNWTVASTFPLAYGWKLIKNFTLTFKDWKVIDYSAEEGEEILKSIIETDKNSCRLWEVAIVPTSSPIYQSWLTYYNTLFDENASCHLAFWMSFETTLKNSENYNEEERDKAWMNESMIHVDFMVGDDTLCITGETHDWEMVEFFRDGKRNV